MAAKKIVLQPIDMNRVSMAMLEGRGLIHRLAPGRDVAGDADGDNLGRSLYESNARFGGHKLIVATIGATTLRHFGCHEDNEDVWMIGLDIWKPLYFVIAACLVDEFEEKIRAGTLEASDLVCLRVRYNDPEASFFIMKKNVPHGEFVVPTVDPAPSFYVTESTNLAIRPVSFGEHVVEFDNDGSGMIVS